MTEELVRAADGVSLSARVSGEGQPLVLVHGTTGSKESWALVEPLLAQDFTVWSYDRRGRGLSGDGESYDVEREVEDLLAVLDATDGRAHLLGHSFGGHCALEASRVADLRSLCLYEPVAHAARKRDAIATTLELLAAGKDEEALKVQLVDVAGVSAEEFSFVRGTPQVWERFLGGAPTIEREVQAVLEADWDPQRHQSLTCPTLLLSGALTANPVYLSYDELLQAAPHAVHTIIAGQRHLAFATDPRGFAAAVTAFLRG